MNKAVQQVLTSLPNMEQLARGMFKTKGKSLLVFQLAQLISGKLRSVSPSQLSRCVAYSVPPPNVSDLVKSVPII